MAPTSRFFAVLVLLGAVAWGAVACKSSTTTSDQQGDSGNAAGEGMGASAGSESVMGGSGAGGSGSGGGKAGANAGGSVSSAGSAGGDSSSGAGGGATSACGDHTCAASEICIRPCCGGTAPNCMPRPQSGVCPPETDPVPFCPGSSGAGCQDKPCKAKAPFCMSVPAACGSAPDCSCLGNVCDPGACGVIDGATVYCMCA
jgi:hypothetical protein